jgi:hypothetical protein
MQVADLVRRTINGESLATTGAVLSGAGLRIELWREDGRLTARNEQVWLEADEIGALVRALR